MADNKALPNGSSAFALAMAEVSVPPSVEITNMDAMDQPSHDSRSSKSNHHHEEGTMVHGLHHCYKVEGGQCLTSFRCNHDHARLSNGHLEEISKIAGPISPSPRRRMSIASSGANHLSAEDGMFRPRANSDAFRGRRGSVAGKTSPGKNSPVMSPAPRRRGSNVVLHSDELHYVYDQYLKNKQ